MKALGEHLQHEGANSNRIHEAFTHTEHMKIINLDEPKIVKPLPDAPDITDIDDLNVKPADLTIATHLIDIIRDYEGNLDIADVTAKLKNNEYADLPRPLNQKLDFQIGYHLNVNMKTQANGTHNIVKWFVFTQKQNVAHMKDVLIHGAAYQPDWVGSAYTIQVRKVLLYLFERLPGNTILYMDWPAEVAGSSSGAPYDNAKRHEGYRFIELYGPRSNNRNQFNIWTDDFINDPVSKIYGWSKSDVKDSLRAYATGSSGARTIDRWPATLHKLHPLVLNAITPTLGTHDHHGYLHIGRSRVGKSTLSKSLGFAISGSQIKKSGRVHLTPSVMVANKLDFFRLEPGVKTKPAIADDIRLSKVPIEDLKVIANPDEEDPLVWARWGGSQFEPNQSRQIIVNPYNKEMEKRLQNVGVGRDEVKFAEFAKVIECNWPEGSDDEDIQAYYNRLHIILYSDTHIYIYVANSIGKNVHRIQYPDPRKPDIFIPAMVDVMKKFKKDRTYLPPDYNTDFAWDVQLLETLSQGLPVPLTLTITGPTLFSEGNSVETYVHPSLNTAASSASGAASSTVTLRVRPEVACGSPSDQMELQVILRKKTVDAGLDGTVIDLLSPTPISRARPPQQPFCGDDDDIQELRSIFATQAASISGQSFCISDDEHLSSPPCVPWQAHSPLLSSPPRKKRYTGNDSDEEFAQAVQASLAPVKLPASSSVTVRFDDRIAAGLPASSVPPVSGGSVSQLPSSDLGVSGVDDHPFSFGYSFDEP